MTRTTSLGRATGPLHQEFYLVQFKELNLAGWENCSDSMGWSNTSATSLDPLIVELDHQGEETHFFPSPTVCCKDQKQR